jgi:hypothetical protein
MKFYKSIPILLAISLLIIGGINFFIVSSSPIDECDNVFSSGMYANYNHKLRFFLREHPLYDRVQKSPLSSFNSKTKDLIETIESPVGSLSEQREKYETFVQQLRELAVKSYNHDLGEEDKESNQLIEDLVTWVFIGVDLNNDLQEFLYANVEPPKGDLLSYLSTTQSLLYENKKFKGLKYELEAEDGFLHGNLPSVYFTISDPGLTKVIRSGRPLNHSLKFPWLTPEITPEFLKYLQGNPGHLYVNVLKRSGAEGKSSKKIEGLESQFPELYVITLDKNSDFYVQDAKKYPGSMESEKFKNLFIEQMTSKKGNYYWSSRLDSESWKKELIEILDEVHQHYFFDKSQLDVSARKDFIELTYLEILDRLRDKWNPLSMNISCHQGMDRAPSLLVLWMLKKNQISDKEAAALLLAPPLIIHNRPSHAPRIARFVSASKRLLAERDYEQPPRAGER